MPDLPLDSAPSVAAAVRLIASRLGAASVHLYTADAAGTLVLVAADGPHGDSLAAIAETLGSEMAVLDVSGVVTDVRFAVGARSGRAALVALGVDLGRLDGAWDAGFADAVALAAGVVEALRGAPPAGPAPRASGGSFPPDASGHARLLHEVATHHGAFDERLDLALEGLADALALDGAALGLVDGAVWSPEAAFDPHGVFPAGPVAVSTLPCSVTVRADGPVAMENAGGGFGAYLGVPVFAGGRTIGTLIAAGRAARTEPFTADERALAESLARWVGAAIGGRASARRLADREAALSAFVDRAPVAMGLVTLDAAAPEAGAPEAGAPEAGAPDDVRFVTVNAAAARLLGDAPDAIAGRLASAVGVGARTRRAWAAGCRSALAAPPGEALALVTLTIETPVGPRVVDATLSRLDVHDAVGARVTCVSFVAEDVTEREHNLRATAERRDAAETAAADHAALFARLHHDLRTPLTTILGYTDLLSPESPPDEIETVREVVLRSGRHLLAMLDDAVVLSEASRASISLVPTAAGALVESAVDVCAAVAEETGVDLRFESTASDAPVLLDTGLVRRIVQTLVAEAVGLSGARHVDARLSEEGAWLVFDVGVREPTGPSAETLRPPVALVERLVYRLGGTLDTPGTRSAGAARWTVRLPRRSAVVVEMPDAAATLDDAEVPGGSETGSAWVSDGLLRR